MAASDRADIHWMRAFYYAASDVTFTHGVIMTIVFVSLLLTRFKCVKFQIVWWQKILNFACSEDITPLAQRLQINLPFAQINHAFRGIPSRATTLSSIKPHVSHNRTQNCIAAHIGICNYLQSMVEKYTTSGHTHSIQIQALIKNSPRTTTRRNVWLCYRVGRHTSERVIAISSCKFVFD